MDMLENNITKSFNEKLIELLKTDSRFVDDEGELIKAAVIDRAWKIDRDLVKLLLSEPEIEKKFFDEIEGHWIFNINTFIEYISDKNFLANSYTRFRNKVGLNIGGKFLRERGEVSLIWPYKDCVLEGGQTKEEEKRKEIFFNEILAQDEIDRLFDPKVLTNFKRYTPDGKQKATEIKRDENGTIKENLIIKGNNLLALHTLKTQFRGKVKLIYIDPPYNTGNDSFGYNDNFNHSSWLTFIKNRLEVARELLRDDGVIFVQCDDNEQAYLKVLMDEIFGIENFIATLPTIMNLKGNNDQFGFAGTHEYMMVYGKIKSNVVIYDFPIDEEEIMSKWEIDEKGYYKKGANLKATGTNAPREKRPNLFFPIYIDENKNIHIKEKPNSISILPITGGKEMSWRWSKDFLEKNYDDVIVVKNASDDFSLYKKQRPSIGEMPTKKPKSIFYKPEYSSGNGTAQIKKLFNDKVFQHAKPEELIADILKITTRKQDVILDFFAGSSTTAAVAHKMKRQWITVEQMDYVKDITVERLKKVIGKRIEKDGEMLKAIEYDTGGISRSVNWQGGGNFIYCELMKYNEAFMDKIQSAKTPDELLKIWKDIAKNSFLNWYVNPEMPKEAVNNFMEIGRFENGLEKQKKLLAELLNKNQLYVNLSEIDDEDFKVSEEDKKLNQSFYGEAYNG
jgi:adenine-specific DNA-methyltransferase